MQRKCLMLILTILKWIFIIILILILAVLVIAAYILIVPFFYDFNGDFDNKSVDFRVHDPLRIYSINADYRDKKLNLKLAFLFNLIKISSPDSNKHTSSKKTGKEKQKKEKTKNKEPDNTEESNEDEKKDNKKESKEKKDRLKSILKERETLAVLKYAVKELFKVLSKLAPKRFYANLSFSTGSPDTTGFVTGGIALLPFVYKNKSKILPDFISEKAYISGTLMLSGYFGLINIVIYLVKMLCQKQIRRILKTFV